MTNSKRAFRATNLRTLLVVVLILVIGLASVGFSFAYGWIKSYALEVNQTVTTAHASAGASAGVSVKATQATLAQEAPVIATLAQFYASPADFQSKAVQDINIYAQKSGLAIGGVTLGGGTPASGASPGATSTTTSLTVKLTSPVSYSSLLKFITYVQNSLPKMRVQSLSLQHATGGGPDSVSIDSLVIEAVTQ